MTDAISTVKGAEGFRGYVYDDATGAPIVPGYTVIGHPTIWWGLCVEKGRVPPIPQRIPDELLEHVVDALWLSLTVRIPWVDELPDKVQAALKEMAYNLGVNGVLGFKRMLAALKIGDLASAADHALDSDWHRNPKTAARAERIAAVIRMSL